MKHTHIREEKIEIEVSVDRVSLYLSDKGISVSVLLEGGGDDDYEDFDHSWESVLSWCKASSQDEGDAESIIKGLRATADNLEAWLAPE